MLIDKMCAATPTKLCFRYHCCMNYIEVILVKSCYPLSHCDMTCKSNCNIYFLNGQYFLKSFHSSTGFVLPTNQNHIVTFLRHRFTSNYLMKIQHSFISPSIHLPAPVYDGLLESIPAVMGRRLGDPLDKWPVHSRATQKDKQTYSHSHTHYGQFRVVSHACCASVRRSQST